MTDRNITKLQRCFELYIKECTYTKGLRPATIKSYSDAFSTFSQLVPEVVANTDLKPEIVTVFFERLALRQLSNDKTLKDSTRYSYYVRLMQFFRFLESKGFLQKGQLTQTIPSPQPPTYDDYRALKKHEIAKLFTAIILNNKGNSFLLTRDLMILKVLLYTGIRKNELLHLKVDDIDLRGKKLRVEGRTSKSKKSRIIPLHPNVSYAISNYLEERKARTNPYLILASRSEEHLSVHGLVYWVQRYKKLSGVVFHLHRCRHTFACNLAQNGTDIMTIKNLMGHKSIVMTERYLRSIGSRNAEQSVFNLFL